jgi:DNA-binding transcriptional MocR family regulator
VVSLGSWSKILGPGLRLGWIEAEGEMLQRLAADGEVLLSPPTVAICVLLTTDCSLLATRYSLPTTTRYSLLATRYSLLATRYSLLATHYSLLTTQVDSGSFSSPLVESLVAKMIEQGAVRVHLEALRTALSRRAVLLAGLQPYVRLSIYYAMRQAQRLRPWVRTLQPHVHVISPSISRRSVLLVGAINGELPEGIPPVVASAPAGYFLWVDLRGADANALRERCTASHGVSFLPGTPQYIHICIYVCAYYLMPQP